MCAIYKGDQIAGGGQKRPLLALKTIHQSMLLPTAYGSQVRETLSRYLSIGVDQPLALGAHLNGDESPW